MLVLDELDTMSPESMTGLAYNTLYYIYFDQAPELGDLEPSGGTVTYEATTTKATAMSGTSRWYVGSILTSMSGGANTGQSDAGGAGAQTGFAANLYAGVADYSINAGAWSNPANINDGNASTDSVGSTTTSTQVILSGFSGISPTYSEIVLNVKTAITQNNSAGPGAVLDYSLNGGQSWTTIYSESITTRALATDQVTLGLSQNLGAIQVRMTLTGAGGIATICDFYEAWLAVQG